MNKTHFLFKAQGEDISVNDQDPHLKAESTSNKDHLLSTHKLPDSIPGTLYLLLPILPRPEKIGIRCSPVPSEELQFCNRS